MFGSAFVGIGFHDCNSTVIISHTRSHDLFGRTSDLMKSCGKAPDRRKEHCNAVSRAEGAGSVFRQIGRNSMPFEGTMGPLMQSFKTLPPGRQIGDVDRTGPITLLVVFRPAVPRRPAQE